MGSRSVEGGPGSWRQVSTLSESLLGGGFVVVSYWDPVPAAQRVVAALDRNPFTGKWSDRKPRNVPGPFYAADTDSMQLGRHEAPEHVCYDNDLSAGFGFEFVYRQPASVAQAEALVGAAQCDIYEGYGWDGDDHWTPDAVRDWWRGRGDLRRWAVCLAGEWAANTHPQFQGHYHDAARGLHDFVAYIDDGLDQYLRGYLFWLMERREPRADEAAPDL